MKRIALLLTGLLAGTVLAACSGGSSTTTTTTTTTTAPGSTPSPAADHDAADVMFAQGMIPHHEQAIEMAELASSRAQNGEVKRLAEQIRGAQEPEIKMMTGWLRSWGAPTTMPGTNGFGGGHGPMRGRPGGQGIRGGMQGIMQGMMSDEGMARLRDLSGRPFDREFLTMMIRHHEGAVQMARQYELAGKYPPAIQLARSIQASQTAEIEKMRALLRQL